jgi:hypothetical protein
MTTSWYMKQRSLVVYQHFGGAYYIHLQVRKVSKSYKKGKAASCSLKMEAVHSSETSINYHPVTVLFISELIYIVSFLLC